MNTETGVLFFFLLILFLFNFLFMFVVHLSILAKLNLAFMSYICQLFAKNWYFSQLGSFILVSKNIHNFVCCSDKPSKCKVIIKSRLNLTKKCANNIQYRLLIGHLSNNHQFTSLSEWRSSWDRNLDNRGTIVIPMNSALIWKQVSTNHLN